MRATKELPPIMTPKDPSDLRERVTEIFGRLFDAPPHVDTNDRFDYESLDLISGRTYQEVFLHLSNGLDGFCLFSLISQEAGQYYLGSMLLWFTERLEWIDANGRIENHHLCTVIFPPSWFGMLRLLQSPITQCWIFGDRPLHVLIYDFLDEVSSFSGFYHSDEDLEEIIDLKAIYNIGET